MLVDYALPILTLIAMVANVLVLIASLSSSPAAPALEDSEHKRLVAEAMAELDDVDRALGLLPPKPLSKEPTSSKSARAAVAAAMRHNQKLSIQGTCSKCARRPSLQEEFSYDDHVCDNFYYTPAEIKNMSIEQYRRATADDRRAAAVSLPTRFLSSQYGRGASA